MLNILTLTRLLVLLFIIFRIAESIDPTQETRCLNCIRNASSLLGIDLTKRCEGYYCGQFQISYTYWAEAGKPGNNQGLRDYEKCARDKSCAEQTVRAYFKKFKRDCNKDGLIDCLDMAALHKGGPTSCSSDWFYKSRYWLAFNRTVCVTNQDEHAPSQRVDLDDQPMRVMKNQSLTTECLDCICEAVSGCNTSANNCGSGPICGPFAISQAYWKDGRRPGASWTACARTKECSTVTMKNYMEKYKRDCNDDGFITCEDYAAIHRRGPRACSNRDLLRDNYWNKFLACRANQKPIKDVNMVKVNDATEELGIQQFNLASRDDSKAQINVTSPAPAEQSINSLNLETQLVRTTQSPVTIKESARFEFPQSPTYDLTPMILEDKIPTTNSPTILSTEHSIHRSIAPTTQVTLLIQTPTEVPKIAPTLNEHQTGLSDEIEYSVPDFPVAVHDVSGTSAAERASNFDKVVTNIVGNPEFSKSYPPVPEIAVQNNQSHHASDETLLLNKPQQKINTYNSRSSNLSSLFSDKGLNEGNRISSECLECICDASSSCDTTVQCISKQREKNRCGLYMISWNQFQESDISLMSILSTPTGVSKDSADEKLYYECTTDKNCAEKLIHLYIEKHQKDCNNDGKIDCYDIAAIHRVGPENCNSGKFLDSQYWKDFNICYTTDRLTTTTTSTIQP